MPPRDRVPAGTARRVRTAAGNKCGYCLAPQHLVWGPLELDHLTPVARGGTDDESNLWLACSICNGHKSDKVAAADPLTGLVCPLFNPRTDRWTDHFTWSADGVRVVGLTPVGRATVSALQLDADPLALIVRRSWVSVGWHPPADSTGPR